LLIIDDEPMVVPIIRRIAEDVGYVVEYRDVADAALKELPSLKPDVALVDLQLPGLSGLDVLRAIRTMQPDCAVVLMTGFATVDTAIAAVKSGARDYLGKPFDHDRLKNVLKGAREDLDRRAHLFQADTALAHRAEFQGMVGRGPAMQDVFGLIRRLAPHVPSALVTGETGTGKELVAKALHNLGPRSARRFLTVNCSAVVETLFESELFGHVRGAFTGATDAKVGLFEHAHEGTLFLDEVGELPLPLQPKLLRAVEYGEIQRVGSLETRKVNVTVLAATNRDLRAEAAAGRFRADLFYRLGIAEIHLPPLRDRREDVPYLAARFIEDSACRLNKQITGLTSAAEAAVQSAPWPGNVRELRNVIERACILSDGPLLGERDLAPMLRTEPPVALQKPSSTASFTLPDDEHALLSTAERDQIQRVLQESKGNKSLAAKRLGVSRRSLYRWLARLDIK
jgi:DNA-binding NtrC family response regulator